MPSVPAKMFATVFGGVYVAVGLLGFAVTGVDGFAATDGHLLLLFEVNPLHNVVHLAVGAVLLTAAGGVRSARLAALAVGAVYAVVGLLGFAITGTSANILALNTADNLLHLATAAAAFLAVSASRQRVTAT